MAERAVVDASAVVDLILGRPASSAIAERLEVSEVHTPAHMDVEVLSAIGRMHRAGEVSDSEAANSLRRLSQSPAHRHALADLLEPAWGLRQSMRLTDAVYVALADRIGAALVTTDAKLARAAGAELIA